MRNKFLKPYSFPLREIKICLTHMGRMTFIKLKQIFGRRSNDLINAMNLIKLVFSTKQRVLSDHFEEHTSIPPNIHLKIIVPVSHQAFWSPVPPGRNILSQWRLTIDTLTWTKVCKLHTVTLDENIFGFDISVIDALAMHILDSFQQLKHNDFYFPLLEFLAFHQVLVQIFLHQFEN